MGRVIIKAERKAAGYACLTLFGVCNSLTHGLRQVASTHPPSGAGMGAGLTDKERKYIDQLANDFHAKGEVLRKLGWRFLNKKVSS